MAQLDYTISQYSTPWTIYTHAHVNDVHNNSEGYELHL